MSHYLASLRSSARPRLKEPNTAAVVRMSAGDVVTADRPFAESKEHLAGFHIIEVPDLDQCLSWASRTTVLVGAPIECQAFLEMRAS